MTRFRLKQSSTVSLKKKKIRTTQFCWCMWCFNVYLGTPTAATVQCYPSYTQVYVVFQCLPGYAYSSHSAVLPILHTSVCGVSMFTWVRLQQPQCSVTHPTHTCMWCFSVYLGTPTAATVQCYPSYTQVYVVFQCLPGYAYSSHSAVLPILHMYMILCLNK